MQPLSILTISYELVLFSARLSWNFAARKRFGSEYATLQVLHLNSRIQYFPARDAYLRSTLQSDFALAYGWATRALVSRSL